MGKNVNRYLLYLQRKLRAREFGIAFRGMSATPVPREASIAGGPRAIAAPPGDPTIAHDVINLWLDDEYGLRRISRRTSTIVDIGGNIGLFSLLARHRFPDATIHTYEPDARILPLTRRNLEGTGVVVHGEGVASSAGHADIISLGSSRLNQVVKNDDGGVALTRMATVVQRIGGKVDLLKLDCEGFEWDIFDDAEAFENVGCIRMEYHLTGDRSVEDLRRAAARLKFSIAHLQKDTGFGIAWLER